MNLENHLKIFSIRSIINSIRKLGLKTKWMIFTFLFVTSLSFALVTFFIKSGKKDLEKELKTWCTSLIDNLAFSTQEAVIKKDYEKLNHYLLGIMNHRDILYSAIFDESNSLIAFQNTEYLFNPNIVDSLLDKKFLHITEHQTRNGDYFYNFVKPIKITNVTKLQDPSNTNFDPRENAITEIKNKGYNPRDQIIGTIFLGISLHNMNAKLNKMRDRAIYIAFVTALIFIVFVYWSVDRISSPIRNLDKATQKIAQGDLSHLVQSDRLDELGRLANSFNEMTARLKESQEEIEQHTQNLEEQVEEQTRELKISEQKYRTLFEQAGTAVALIDADEKFIMINKGFEVLSGQSKADIEGRMTLANFLSSETCKKINQLCGREGKYKALSVPIIQESIFTDHFGNRKNINLTMSLIPGTLKLLISIVDVTELRELQKRLARSEQLAAIGELSAAIAHEIRNPLVAINTSVGILKSGLNLKGEDQELMNIISEESMRLNKIVDDFLNFARPNEPQLTNTDINELIRETLILLRSNFNNNIKKNIDLSETLPVIYVDPDQVKQVLMNIIINAIEAMPEGGSLNVSTQHKQNRNGNSFLQIEISDTGVGIERSHLKKIFQPFFTNKHQGVGMGLAICERIIQNHGGEINVSSEYGSGSQFMLILPVKET